MNYTEEIHFSGHVQGVGFRYSSLQVAREYIVTGEVLNLPDGRVKLVIQGDEREVKAYREALCLKMKPYIREVKIRVLENPRLYKGFDITG